MISDFGNPIQTLKYAEGQKKWSQGYQVDFR